MIPGRAFLGAVLAVLVGGCGAIPRSYPVKATVDVEVAGRPVSVERVFQCETFMHLGMSCPGCARWRSSLTRIAEPLPTGGALLVHFGNVCAPVTGLLATSAQSTMLAWVDALDDPTLVEIYPTDIPALPYGGTRRPRIALETFSLRFRSLRPGEPANLSEAHHERTAEWFVSTFTDNKQAREKPVRWLVGYSVMVMRRPFWSQFPWLAAQVADATETKELRILAEESPDFHAAIDARMRDSAADLGNAPDVFIAPLEPVYGDEWMIDDEHRGIYVVRHIGRVRGTERSQVVAGAIDFGSWTPEQVIRIGAREYNVADIKYLYDPSIDSIIMLGFSNVFHDYE